MPNMNGLEATKIILDSFPTANIRIIFISADLSIKQEALDSGADDFLVKPVSFVKVLTSINRE